MAVHDERAFQRVIADELVVSGGWVERHHSEVDRDTRLLTDDLVGYLTETQPDQVERFAKVAGSQWDEELARIVASDLDREAGRVLPLLRGGKKVRGGVRFQFCQFKPTHDLNADLVANHEANRLAVVLEAPVRRHDGHWGAVDIALFVNGIPVADAELKNPNTAQDVRHAIHQYKHERDPRDTLLGRRSVVHFAVDTEHVHMATHLAGADTGSCRSTAAASPTARAVRATGSRPTAPTRPPTSGVTCGSATPGWTCCSGSSTSRRRTTPRRR